jgi:type IV secretory pathway VirB2 component (pilin)
MVAKLMPLLIPLVIMGDMAAPSLTQGVLDVILAAIAGGIWKLVAQIRIILAEIRYMRGREPLVEFRLNDHKARLKNLDGKNEENYYPE